jgi:hypothetical protein
MFYILWLLPGQPEPPEGAWLLLSVGNEYSTYQEAKNEASRLSRNQKHGRYVVRYIEGVIG